MTEAQMLAGIKMAAKQLGYLFFHNTYAIGSERGFPDVVIVGHGRTWFFELKGPKPKVYPEQEAWIQRLRSCDQDARFVFPHEYDAVMAELIVAYQEAHE